MESQNFFLTLTPPRTNTKQKNKIFVVRPKIDRRVCAKPSRTYHSTVNMNTQSYYPPDLFSHLYDTILSICFSKLKPNQIADCFPLFQDLYKNNPSQFILFSPLHQNSKSDCLHISISITSSYCSYMIHINGYWKNKFIVTDMTYCLTHNCAQSDVKLLAKFD